LNQGRFCDNSFDLLKHTVATQAAHYLTDTMTSTPTTTHHRICPFCEACCGLEIKVSGGEVQSIRGHDADVFSAGYLCPKGVALKDLHEDPDRLRMPLIKRDGVFVQATWDEAFDEIEQRLLPIIKQHGDDAVAITVGNPPAHKMGLLLYLPKLLKSFGTRNFFSASTLDQMPKQLSNGLMFGHWLTMGVPDIVRCDHLLILGANPVASNGSLWTVPDFRGKAKALRARGGKLVVIDPRRTETADLADAHHFIRPGGDVFLLLGMVHTLFAEGLVKLDRLAALVAGLDAVRDAVLPFTPEKVATRCGIDAATIRTLTRELAQAPRAAVYGRMGTSVQAHGTLCAWLIDVLNVLTGNLDRAGGVMFPKAAAFAANTSGEEGKGRGIRTGRWKSRVSGAPEIFGELPMNCLAEEMETPGPGQVKALITLASNPTLSAPNGARLSAALEKLDFMLSMDIYLNETTRHADVILPGLSPLEDSHYDVPFPQFSFRNQARYSAAVLPPSASQQPEWQTLLKLSAIAQGLGAKADVLALDDAMLMDDLRKLHGNEADAVMAALAPRTGPDRRVDWALRSGPYGDEFGKRPDGLTLNKVITATGGIDLGELQPRLPQALRTPSGLIELAPPMLIADLQRVVSALEDTSTDAAPDMVMIGRRDVRSNNSWMHNLPLLAKGRFRCTALVNPTDANRFGLSDGGMARITSTAGHTVTAQVELSDTVMPGVVSLPHGWGHDAAGAQLRIAALRPGVNLNVLMDERQTDPLSGNAVLSGVAVTLRAA
jgi:anaerobic selenocysteine-containing dehydrogenase